MEENKGKYEISVIVLINNAQEMKAFYRRNITLIGSQKHVQWILLFRDKSDYSGISVLRKHMQKSNVCTVVCDETIQDAYKKALDVAEGRYINISNEYMTFAANVFPVVRRCIKNDPRCGLISTNYAMYNRKIFISKTAKSIYSRYPKKEYIEMREDQEMHYFAHSYFIRKDLLRPEFFTNICHEETETIALLHAMKKERRMLFLENVYVFYKREIRRGSSNYYGAHNIAFYTDSLVGNFLPLMEEYKETEEPPVWLQRIVYYLLYIKYFNNYNARDKELLHDDALKEFYAASSELLKYIDDRIITGNVAYEQLTPPLALKYLFMYLKHEGDEEYLNRDMIFETDPQGEPHLYYCLAGQRYEISEHESVETRAFNVKGDNLKLDMSYFSDVVEKKHPGAITAFVNNEKVKVRSIDIYNLTKVFGQTIHRKYNFQIDVPVSETLKDNTSISFYMTINGEKKKLPVTFPAVSSKLISTCPSSYWHYKDDIYLIYQNRELVFRKFDEAETVKCERALISEIMAVRKNPDSALNSKDIKAIKKTRTEYFKTKEMLKGRRIWIHFDKLFKAGDNGEYMFRYSMANERNGIEHYYIINGEAPECERLKKEFPGHILIYGTQKCKSYGLLAENIIATHPDIIEFLGIGKTEKHYVKDLYNPNLICIAHGVTIQKNADYQNRLYDNTMFYTTSSEYEVDHLKKPVYGYSDDEIALTGMARFDGLVNRDKKQILITPTWRRSIVGDSGRNTARNYSDAFRQSSYYKIYNSLINDERIIQTAKRKGYRVIFLLHPLMSAQAEDYDRNDYVDFLQASGDMSYEKILTESSLMVTDYSGIHYDFGYMRKPVIYYQPKEVPMRFEEGGMKFKTMGFGPLCTEYEEAVSLICEYVENDCRMPETYKANADDFFAFDDCGNCSRIYDEIYRWTEDRKNK